MTRNRFATQGRVLIQALKRKEDLIGIDAVRTAFVYEPDIGVLKWAARQGGRAPAGAVAGYQSNGYRRVQFNGVAVMAHRICWAIVFGEWPKGILDHIDGDRSNNRIANLRDGDYRQNRENQRLPRVDCASGIQGAYWHKSTGKWTSAVQVAGKHHYLGLFQTAEAAGAAYLTKKRELHSGCSI